MRIPVIRMKTKISIESIVRWILVVGMCLRLIRYIVPTLNVLAYIIDIVDFALFIYALKVKRNKKDLQPSVYFFGGLIIFDIFMFILKQQSIFNFLWGVRTHYRYFWHYIAIVCLFTVEGVDRLYKLIYNLLGVNIVVVFIEWGLGFQRDNLSGLFGVTLGTNAGVNLFLSIVYISLIVDYFNKEGKHFLLRFFIVFIWVVMAELKYFFIEAVIFTLLALVFLGKMDLRKIKITCSLIMGGVFGVIMLGYFYPEFADFFSFDTIAKYVNAYGIGEGGYKRVNAIPYTNDMVFNNDILKELFGLGLGSADYSSIELFDSRFYDEFKHLNYTALFYGFVYIERGWFGILWYVLFYVMTFWISLKETRKTDDKRIRGLLYKSAFLAIGCLMVMIYDDGLIRTPCGFMVYTLLAVPLVCKRKRLRGEFGT